MSSAAAGSGPELSAEDQKLLESLVEILDRPRLDIDESELLQDPARYKRSTLPAAKIPTFGEASDDCGELLPTGLFPCDSCYDVKLLPHVCYRYDCPRDGLRAVRRRAAGSSSSPGIVPKLGAIRAVLDDRRESHQVYQHFTVSLPLDFFFRSDEPLERGFQLCRELMDEIGVQGLVGLHPWRGDTDDDRGFWKRILGNNLTWEDARDRLVYGPHFHVVGVGPKGGIPGGAVTRELEARTGVVLERFSPRNSNVSVYGAEEMAHAVTYTLSHSAIYTDSNGDRRLAARLKGPDINEIDVYDRYKREHQANVNDAAETTLGIGGPPLECQRIVDNSDNQDSVEDSHRAPGGRLTSSLTKSSGPGSSGSGPPVIDVTYGEINEEPQRCGGNLRHISTYDLQELAELEARHDVDSSDLGDAYRSYQDYMKAQGMDPSLDGRPDIPELGDRPPPN